MSVPSPQSAYLPHAELLWERRAEFWAISKAWCPRCGVLLALLGVVAGDQVLIIPEGNAGRGEPSLPPRAVNLDTLRRSGSIGPQDEPVACRKCRTRRTVVFSLEDPSLLTIE